MVDLNLAMEIVNLDPKRSQDEDDESAMDTDSEDKPDNKITIRRQKWSSPAVSDKCIH